MAESGGRQDTGLLELRRAAYFLDWPVNQYGFRLLAHHDFQSVAEVQAWFENEFIRLGDSKVVEESIKIGRRAEQHAQEQQAANGMCIYHQLTREKTPLTWRGLKHVQVSSDSYYEPTTKPGEGIMSWKDMFNPRSTEEKPEWHLERIHSKGNVFVSKSTAGQRSAVCAMQALRYLGLAGSLCLAMHAWQTGAFVPGHFYRKVESKMEPRPVMASHGQPWRRLRLSSVPCLSILKTHCQKSLSAFF